MDTGWGASFPNRPMVMRSLDGSAPGADKPLNSMNILSVMVASEVDVVPSALAGKTGSRDELMSVVTSAEEAIVAKKSRRVGLLVLSLSSSFSIIWTKRCELLERAWCWFVSRKGAKLLLNPHEESRRHAIISDDVNNATAIDENILALLLTAQCLCPRRVAISSNENFPFSTFWDFLCVDANGGKGYTSQRNWYLPVRRRSSESSGIRGNV